MHAGGRFTIRDGDGIVRAMGGLRALRRTEGLLQREFADLLQVPINTLRLWDSGIRPVPPRVLHRARAAVAERVQKAALRAPSPLDRSVTANERALPTNPHASLPLATVARLIHVHVRTLNAAARDGRRRVSYDTWTTFRSLRTRATLADAEMFLRGYREKGLWPTVQPPRLTWDQIPSDYDTQVRRIRRRLRLTQAAFATRVGAARKAVVYQWESRRRCPSPVFWQRIRGLGTPNAVR
jgi:DNA-binding transcriptional regulator YiaG